MNTAAETQSSAERPIDRWFANYSGDHRNAGNQLIHIICVPAILWSVVALLWCIPSPGTWFRAGFWAGLAMLATALFYYRASRMLGLGMIVVYVLMGLLTRWLHDTYGTSTLLWLAIGVFVVAWIGQFIGHSKLFEGKRPSFFTDLTYLLIGPAWVLSKLYRKLGIRY
ncbi:DUF962 domain-containing protein [Lysobacter panacisoli]|uniref:DUF962 domain-containing protein n=1 Tax=Lysobacter panacisoli TaxID=1255263 RepID=A0ABP9L3N6_9GAMM|nr:Mpo1-like protein [Lysobacter panacisoli]